MMLSVVIACHNYLCIFSHLLGYDLYDKLPINHLLFKEKYPALQAILTGEIIPLVPKEFQRQGHRERALVMLHQMIEDAHKGKRQFLSGNKRFMYSLCGNIFILYGYKIVVLWQIICASLNLLTIYSLSQF